LTRLCRVLNEPFEPFMSQFVSFGTPSMQSESNARCLYCPHYVPLRNGLDWFAGKIATRSLDAYGAFLGHSAAFEKCLVSPVYVQFANREILVVMSYLLFAVLSE
jgi:hypothetical protein